MAKIDLSKIKGFSEMTVEQKLAALESYEIAAPDYSGYVKKDIYDKAASELAEWKRKHNALLSEEDKKKQENEEYLATLQAKVEALEKEKLISGHKAKFLALGYDEELADETARAMANGETDKVFSNQKKFLDRHDKAYGAQLMGQISVPPAGNPTGNAKPNYVKLIENAQGSGDYAAVAYYTRLSEQEKQNIQ